MSYSILPKSSHHLGTNPLHGAPVLPSATSSQLRDIQLHQGSSSTRTSAKEKQFPRVLPLPVCHIPSKQSLAQEMLLWGRSSGNTRLIQQLGASHRSTGQTWPAFTGREGTQRWPRENITLKRIHEMIWNCLGLCQMWEAGGINEKTQERSGCGAIEWGSLRAGKNWSETLLPEAAGKKNQINSFEGIGEWNSSHFKHLEMKCVTGACHPGSLNSRERETHFRGRVILATCENAC